jgi:hypothetical protein
MAVDVGAAAPSGGLVCRGGGLGDHVEQLLHGAEKLLAWIGWQSCVASAARLPARSTPLKGGGVNFRPGRRPWSTSSFSLCSLGCGWLGRAALWLVCGRWYVGMAVPEGGLCVSRPCIVWAMSVVWRCSSGRLASSALERPMFAPPIACTASFSPALG